MKSILLFLTIATFDLTVRHGAWAADAIPSETISRFPDEDPDSDGLTNDEERQSGTLSDNPDTDSDGVPDGLDGWALDPNVSPARLPFAKYTVVSLTAVGFTEPAYEWVSSERMNDRDDILDGNWASARMWVDGSFIAIPQPPDALMECSWTAGFSDQGEVATFFTRTTGWYDSSLRTHATVWSPSGGFRTLDYVPPERREPPNWRYGEENRVAAWRITRSGAVLGSVTGGYRASPQIAEPETFYSEQWYHQGLRWSPNSFSVQRLGDLRNWFASDTQPPVSTGRVEIYLSDENRDGIAIGSETDWGMQGVTPVPSGDGTEIHATYSSVIARNGVVIHRCSPGTTPSALNDAAEPMIVGESETGIRYWLVRSSGVIEKQLSHFDPVMGTVVPTQDRAWDVNDRFEVVTTRALIQNGARIDFRNRLPFPSDNPGDELGFSHSEINANGCILGYSNFDDVVLLIPSDLAVDSNRDGTIRFAGNFAATRGKPVDKTTRALPFRFWCNDDNDTHNETGGEDVIPVLFPDSEDDEINSLRDLEDFARLHIHVGAFYSEITSGTFLIGLRWSGDAAGTPKIKVYRSADAAGSDSYLKEGAAAMAQFEEANRTSLGEVAGSTPLILPADVWTGYNSSNSTRCLLFEGSGEGKGQLCITLHKADGTLIGEGPGVWMDLKNVKTMYERAKGTPEPMLSRPWDTPSVETGFVRDPNGFEFEKPFDESKSAIVFVHGIHPPFAGSGDAYRGNISVAETTFKRLWHAGFKGRFAFYKWPALTPADWDTLLSLLNLTTTPNPQVVQSDFNESEWRAYQHGKGLYLFVNTLPFDYERNLYAHSQGNAVVASAFVNYTMPAKTWIITQGAIPRGCFDAEVANDLTNSGPDLASDGGYKGWLAASIPARVVNFYNELDQITGDVWLANHEFLKPTISDVGINRYIYSYSGTKREVSAVVSASGLPLGQRAVTDIQESMSMLAKSKTKSIGHGSNTNGEIDDGVDLNSEFGFSNSHGSQWENTIQEGPFQYFRRLRDEIE